MLTVGDELLKIDGTPVSEVLRTRIEPFISASTPQHLAVQSYPRILQGERDSSVRLRLRSVSGHEREAILTRGYARLPGFALTRPNGPIHDGVSYVAIDSFAGDRSVQQFEKMLPEIRAARGLILDLRENSGGSTSNANRILSHLTDKPLAGSRWRTRQYRPAFRAWGHSEEWHEGSHDPVRPAQGAFLGPVVVLTGPRTISAAEDFLVVLKASGRARLVGERTAGSTGQPLIVHLPAGGIARICTKRDTYPDGSDFVGVGVIPDVEVAPTVADIVAGRDTILDRGLAELGELMNQ
jgi:carboxyl-terminal processing protease